MAFACLALATPVLQDLPTLRMLEAQSLDWRYRLRGPLTPAAPVAVVAIDDRTIRAQQGWPVPRDQIAHAVDRLHSAGARVVAIDLLMRARTGPASETRVLADVLDRNPDTVLPVAATFNGSNPDTNFDFSRHGVPVLRRTGAAKLPVADGAIAPLEPLAAATRDIGHVNVVKGADGALRHLHPAIRMAGHAVPAIPAVAVRRYHGIEKSKLAVHLPDGLRMAGKRYPIGPDGRWTFQFYGPHRSFPTISLQRVLEGDAAQIAETVRDRIVWLGATGTGLGDTFVTPFDPELPGVEAFATATANLFNREFLSRGQWTLPVEMAAVLLVGILTLSAAGLRPARLSIALAPCPTLAWSGLTQLAFVRWTMWLNWTVPTLVGIATLGGVAGWRVLLSETQRRRLASYLPWALVEGLAQADTPTFADREQRAVILFVDLRGFTSRSEIETPAGTADLLKQLHAVFEAAAHSNHGYVDSFAGDGAMLVFGVPDTSARDPVNAVACARELLTRADRTGFGIRIGVHYGPVQLAALGGPQRRQFSLAGDTVNVASRLMDVAKKHDTALAVSEATTQAVSAAGADHLLAGLRRAPGEEIRGRAQPLDVRVLASAQPDERG